jgi:tetrahydromethanopterin S-methyltransferase subunit B
MERTMHAIAEDMSRVHDLLKELAVVAERLARALEPESVSIHDDYPSPFPDDSDIRR